MLMVYGLDGGGGCSIDEMSKWLLFVGYPNELFDRTFGKCRRRNRCVCLKWYNGVCKPMDNGI